LEYLIVLLNWTSVDISSLPRKKVLRMVHH
jgi:hypothetical protein